MKTLSIRGFWGYLIALGIKDVENRTTLKNIKGKSSVWEFELPEEYYKKYSQLRDDAYE